MKILRLIFHFFIFVVPLSGITSCTNTPELNLDYSFEAALNVDQSIQEFDTIKFESFDDLNLGFFKGNVWIKLEIENEENENKSYMFINNDRFNRNYTFYKLDALDNSLKLINHGKDGLNKDYRTFNNPNPNLKIDLAANEQATFLIVTGSDGRAKDATPKIISLENYFDFINENAAWSIAFYGIISCLLVINFFQWTIYRQKIYFYYIFYLFSTFLITMGIEGILYNIKLEQLTIDHIIFVSIKLWALSLITYTSKFLEIQIVAPKYYRFIQIVLFVVLGGTILYQFIFYNSSIQHLHYFENVLSFLWLLLIIGAIFLSARTRRSELRYYLIPLFCFILFTVFGLIDVQFQIFPGNSFTYVKLGAIVELVGFTYFMTVLIKKKLKKAEQLEYEILENRKELIITTEKLEEKDKLLSAKTGIEKTDVIGIFKLLENSLTTDIEWNEFKLKFKELNPEFHEKLLAHQPNLIKSEIRLLTLIKIGYSQKEIASILSIAPDSVKKARSRVRKKINTTENVSLKELLSQL